MANLKIDLVNKLNNDKFYDEFELVRLAQEPNMTYRTKIEEMTELLGRIAITNAKLGLIEQYFQEPAASQVASVPQGQSQANVHQGQSHGE
jgi:hypothetical protein